MERSPYLAQALQVMQAAPQQTPQGPDLGAMMQQAKVRQAWEAANPGQSYAGHNLGQMAQNIQGVPGQLAQVPGNLQGLFSLGGR